MRHSSAAGLIAAVDLGGTKIAAAVVDASGGVSERVTVPTPALAGPDAVLDAIASAVRSSVTTSGGGALIALGVGAAGTIDADHGIVVSATDAITGWAGTDVRAGLAARLDLDPSAVVVENDVHAHAAGEALAGAGAGARSMIMVAVGTGVGGAIVDDGRVLRGVRGVAGAIGHIPVPDAAGLPCSCGGTGHLEAIASGPALLRLWHDAGGRDVRHGSEIVALAEAGDALATHVLIRSATALGAAIAGLVTTLDPELVVIGGGLADAGVTWWDAVVTSARHELVEVQREIRIERAALGTDAALVGAGLRAWTTTGDATDA